MNRKNRRRRAKNRAHPREIIGAIANTFRRNKPHGWQKDAYQSSDIKPGSNNTLKALPV